jgi:NAD(P)-dependent dehydrogenase (short-subunit alcohol dehydrogenase family)
MEIPDPRELLDLTGKVALVTGSGRGIGSAIALRLAEAGADVVASYRESAAGAEAVASRIRGLGRRAGVLQADLTRGAEVDKLVAGTVETLGRLDILVNNAGLYPLVPLVEMTEADWDQVLDSNLRSVFLCTRAAARQMIEQGEGGAVVNVASIEGESPLPLHSHYTSAKAGVLMHTRSAAQELGGHGIRVNAVSPGLIWRQGLEEDWPEGVARWKAAAPLGRLGMPEDVADACLFLASPAARWITGANLRVDGGVMTHQIF